MLYGRDVSRRFEGAIRRVGALTLAPVRARRTVRAGAVGHHILWRVIVLERASRDFSLIA